MGLPEKGSEDRGKAELQQLLVLETYAKILINDIASIRLRVEISNKLDMDDRIRLRGIMSELNLMWRNMYEPLIINDVEK